MSIGTLVAYGLFSLTPKFLSPLSSKMMKTPMCIRPTLAVINTVPMSREIRNGGGNSGNEDGEGGGEVSV